MPGIGCVQYVQWDSLHANESIEATRVYVCVFARLDSPHPWPTEPKQS